MSEINVTLSEIVSFMGMTQCVFIVVYVLFRFRHPTREGLPLLYFTTLGTALFLDLASRFWGDAVEWYFFAQWFFWFTGPPLAVLLIIQIAQINKSPIPRNYLVLALVPAAAVVSIFLVYGLDYCAEIFTCAPVRDLFVVTGVVACSFCLFEVWLIRGIMDNVRLQKNGRERFWLIIMLMVTTLTFLGAELVSVGAGLTYEEIETVRGVIGIGFAYLASTSLFRIYPQTFRDTPSAFRDDALSEAELEVAGKIEKLFDLDKIYQEPSYSRSDLARELSVSETTISRVINLHFQKSFPQLLNEHRIEDAKRMLVQTDANIKVIAEEVGFNSIASFNRVFREVSDTSPGGYRKRHGG